MQKFSIARLSIKIEWPQITEANEIYLRLEPNGNVMWTIDKELASQWTHENSEIWLRAYNKATNNNCYLVEAVKTDA